MKFLVRFLITFLIANHYVSLIVSQYFLRGNWSYTLANIAIFVPVFELVRIVLTWAFETKVADVYFQGQKVGKIKEEE